MSAQVPARPRVRAWTTRSWTPRTGDLAQKEEEKRSTYLPARRRQTPVRALPVLVHQTSARVQPAAVRLAPDEAARSGGPTAESIEELSPEEGTPKRRCALTPTVAARHAEPRQAMPTSAVGSVPIGVPRAPLPQRQALRSSASRGARRRKRRRWKSHRAAAGLLPHPPAHPAQRVQRHPTSQRSPPERREAHACGCRLAGSRAARQPRAPPRRARGRRSRWPESGHATTGAVPAADRDRRNRIPMRRQASTPVDDRDPRPFGDRPVRPPRSHDEVVMRSGQTERQPQLDVSPRPGVPPMRHAGLDATPASGTGGPARAKVLAAPRCPLIRGSTVTPWPTRDARDDVNS